jgi:hypothetical protein
VLSGQDPAKPFGHLYSTRPTEDQRRLVEVAGPFEHMEDQTAGLLVKECQLKTWVHETFKLRLMLVESQNVYSGTGEQAQE